MIQILYASNHIHTVSPFIEDKLKGPALPVGKKKLKQKNSNFLAYNTHRPPLSVRKKI